MWLCRVGPGKRKDCRMAIQNSFRIPCQSHNNYTSLNFAILYIKKLLNLHVSTVPKFLSQRRWKTISIQEIYEQCTILLLLISAPKLPFTGTLHTTLAFCFILLPNSHLKPSHQVVDGPAWLVYMLHANLENQNRSTMFLVQVEIYLSYSSVLPSGCHEPTGRQRRGIQYNTEDDFKLRGFLKRRSWSLPSPQLVSTQTSP